MSSPEVSVEVAYARTDRQWLVIVPLRDGLTALGAVQASGLLEECPELAGQQLLLGIYGERIEEGRLLRSRDRVEIYRPLRNDPRDMRRRAAQAARSGGRPSPRGKQR